MAFDINNNYSGTFYGKDRIGFTTPDPDGSEILRPFLTVPYPAPWLPGRRLDEGHPVGALVVLSAGYIVGQDKNGALIPAGMRSGATGNGGPSCYIIYSRDDVGMAYNPRTGLLVQAAGEAVLLAVASDALLPTPAFPASVAGTVAGPYTVVAGVNDKLVLILNGTAQAAITLAPGTLDTAASVATTINAALSTVVASMTVGGCLQINTVATGATVTLQVQAAGSTCAATLGLPTTAASGSASVTPTTYTVDGVTFDGPSVAFAQSCNLIPGGVARGIGYCVRNVFQYLGGVNVLALGDSAKGMSYTLDGVIPVKFRVHNYMHEPGTAIQTSFVLRMPWIGADLNALNVAAYTAGLSPREYSYDDFSRSFLHFVGDNNLATGTQGKLYNGCSVVADDQNSSIGSGHLRPYNPSLHTPDQIIGRVIGIESMYPIKDYADRVRTQFDRAQSFVGPWADRHPITQMLGGSATRGMDYAINLSTKGLLRALLTNGITNIPAQAGTYVWCGIRTI